MTAPLYALTDTWNNSATVFTAILMNVTDTASDASSLLLDLQIAGASKFRVTKGGAAQSSIGYSRSLNAFSNAAGTSGMVFSGSDIFFNANSVNVASIQAANELLLNSVADIGWSSSTPDGSGADLKIFRDAAQILAQRNSTNAQTFRVYNTYTDSSNYERGVFDWTSSSNTLVIGTQNAGTGAARDVTFNCTSGYFRFGIVGSGTTVLIKIGTGIRTNGGYEWASGQGDSTPDLRLDRVAAKVANFNDSAAGPGWFQWGGQARVSSDVNSNNTTTLAIATGLTAALQAGRTYRFEVHLSFTCTAAQGIRAAMVGTGGLTATAIQYDGFILDSGANGVKGNAQATALGTVVANSALTGTAGVVIIKGVITVNVAGNLEVQFAQSVAAANNTTVKRGSTLLTFDMP